MAQARDASQLMEAAVLRTAPGTPLRDALDMVLAARQGALVCIGDVDRVLALGNGGFPLDVAFTANRLFELSKMDGAIVVDADLSTILRANFHLSPDPAIPTLETGMRHRTAARMSMATDAVVVAVSQCRSCVSVYVHGSSFRLGGPQMPGDARPGNPPVLVDGLRSARGEKG
jgi:diadenylate cyclase